MSEELKVIYDDMRRTWEQFKGELDGAKAERKTFGEELGQTKEKLAKMEAHFQALEDGQKTIIEAKAAQEQFKKDVEEFKEFMARATRPGRELSPSSSEVQKGSDSKAFGKFIRKGQEYMTPEEMKGLATDSDSAGGYLLPVNLANTIIELNVLMSPVRQVATVQTIGTGDALEIPKEGATAFNSGWVTERASRTETTAGTFAKERIQTFELEACPYATQKMLDDAVFGIEQYISSKLAQQFAKIEGTAFINGTGVGQPEGIMVNSSVGTNVVTATNAFTGALLIDLLYLLEEPYASNATWLTCRSNLGKIRQLSGTEGYLWQPGIAMDKPPTLLDRPYVACNDILAVGTATAAQKIIAIGDFRSGYWIVDRQDVRVLRDPYSAKPNIAYYTYKRVGGQVVLPEAIKIGIKNS